MLKGGQRLGAGRPAAADSRRHLIQFRVTEDELRDVKETASHLGLTVTDLVRKALGLAVLLLAVGCSVERPSNPPADPPPGADAVEARALEEWSAALLPAGRTLTDPPPVLWFEGDCLDYSDDTYCEDGRTVFVPGDVEIHLAIEPGETASRSALAHELLHWSLHETGHGWDGEHTADEWTLVPPLQAALAAEGM